MSSIAFLSWGLSIEEAITFTFYSDMSQNPYVIKMTLSLNQEIHKVFNISLKTSVGELIKKNGFPSRTR